MARSRGSRYDRDVGGVTDEVSARSALIAMQERIARGPYAALGIGEAASIEEVRGAFLELTKRFHPARFGRMSQELQKLSNEVFLGIKSAHDQLMRATGGTRGSAPHPVVAESSQSYARPGSPPPGNRPSTGPQPVVVPPRTLTPMRGIGNAGNTQPPDRPSSPSIPPTTPPQGRTPTPSPLRALSPPPQRPAPQDTASQRPMPVQRTAPVFDERAQLQTALDLMRAGDWRAAREALHALAARVPQSKQYRALLCYARGREAHVAGRFDDAALEYMRALQLDPDLVQAKQALVDAQRRK